jgi:hypothetical protein
VIELRCQELVVRDVQKKSAYVDDVDDQVVGEGGVAEYLEDCRIAKDKSCYMDRSMTTTQQTSA